MQMRRFYLPTDKAKRAAELRNEALQMKRAGFAMFADAMWEEAEWLSPTPREDKPRRGGNRATNRGSA